MISAPSLRIKLSGFKPWPGHCVAFGGKHYCHSASLPSGAQLVIDTLLWQPAEKLGSNLELTYHPAGALLLLAASYRGGS